MGRQPSKFGGLQAEDVIGPILDLHPLGSFVPFRASCTLFRLGK